MKQATFINRNFGKNLRRDYTKTTFNKLKENLLNIQTEHYNFFLNEGIKEVFNDFFPFLDEDGEKKANLFFLGYELGEANCDPIQAKNLSKIYLRPLYVTFLSVFTLSKVEIQKENEEIDLVSFFSEFFHLFFFVICCAFFAG